MKEGKDINTLQKQLAVYQVVSIVGNVKNAGKTTVLNYLISGYQNNSIAITSIGLDGEKIDQVTFLPKPRIFVYQNMFVATAKSCLDECEASYEIIKKTNIETSLGPIYIIKIKEEGNCLVGGPSNLKDIKDLVSELKAFNLEKILIDGAFSRTTFAQVADATILSIGASFSPDLNKITSHAYNTTKLFDLSKAKLNYSLKDYDEIVFIDDKDQLIQTNINSTLDYGKEVVDLITPEIKYIFIPNAVSESFIKAFIKERKRINADLIITTPTNLIVDEKLLGHIFKLKQKIYVLENINLVAMTFNPFSPKGNVNSIDFKNALLDKIKIPLYNVLEEGDTGE